MSFHFHPGPLRIRPPEFTWIDNAGGTMRPVWLKTRGRIGMKMFGLVYPEPIERTGADVCIAGKITALFGLNWVKCARGSFFRALLQDEFDLLGFWSPNPEVRFVRADQFGADGIASFDLHTTFSLLRRTPALHRRDLSFHFTRRNNMRM